MTFDDLTSTEFENFCFELLQEMGLKNVNWRKGTGYNSGPSDSGRDIECEYHRYDILLKRVICEKWFIECKHYKAGVPAESFSGALAWANSLRPDRLILMTSNFLSNSCKDCLLNFEKNNKPAYGIEQWEKPHIEKLATSHPELLKKYGIIPRDKILDIINPYHLEYITHLQWNTITELKNALNKINVDDRLKIYSFAGMVYLNDGFINLYNEGSLGDAILDKVECVSQKITERFAVTSFVDSTLRFLLHGGDYTKSADIAIRSQNHTSFCIENKQEIIQFMKEKNYILPDDYEITEEEISELYVVNEEDMYNKLKDGYELYTEFCEMVVKHLLDESNVKLCGLSKAMKI